MLLKGWGGNQPETHKVPVVALNGSSGLCYLMHHTVGSHTTTSYRYTRTQKAVMSGLLSNSAPDLVLVPVFQRWSPYYWLTQYIPPTAFTNRLKYIFYIFTLNENCKALNSVGNSKDCKVQWWQNVTFIIKEQPKDIEKMWGSRTKKMNRTMDYWT